MKGKRKTACVAAGGAVGAGVSVCATFVLSAIVAKLVDTGALGEGWIGHSALAITFLSAWVGASAGYGHARQRRLEVSALSCGIYFLLLLALTAVAFGGMYTGVWKSLLLVVSAALVAALPALRKGRGVKRKRIHR